MEFQLGSCHQHPSHCWDCHCCCCRMGNRPWLHHLRPGTQHCAKFHRMNGKHCCMAHGPKSTLNRKLLHAGMECCRCFGRSTHLHTENTRSCIPHKPSGMWRRCTQFRQMRWGHNQNRVHHHQRIIPHTVTCHWSTMASRGRSRMLRRRRCCLGC